MTKIEFQPFFNFTIFQTECGKFCIKQNEGCNAVRGQPSLEAAIRMANAHFGNLIIHKGTLLGA